MKTRKKDTYDAAIIGIGRIGMMLERDPKRLKPATHFGMWASHPRVKLVGVCDSDPGKRHLAKSMLPTVQTYASASEMLEDTKPDIVSIATWKDTHYEMMKLALSGGVAAIVCEKPIAERYEHAKEIVEDAGKLGIHLFINHRRRFDPLLYVLRDEMRKGIIGEIMQVSTYYVYGLVTTGTHVIDTLRFLLKDITGEIGWVAAFPNSFSHHHPENDACLDGFVFFENGLKASVQSLNIKDYDIFEFHFYGRHGRIVLKNIGRDIEVYRVEESPEHEGFTELGDQPVERRGGAPRDQFRCLATNVIDCLEGKAISLSSGEDSLKALEVLLAMQRSAADGGAKTEIG